MYLPYTITLALFTIAGLAIAAWCGRKIIIGKKTSDWNEIEATITYNEPASGESTEIPQINYKYEVDGQAFEQTVEQIEEAAMPGQTHPLLVKYPEHSTLAIFYNPDEPSKSSMKKGAQNEDWVMFWIGISTMLLGLATLI